MNAHEKAPARELTDLVAEVRRIEIESTRLVTGVMAGGYASVFRGAGVEFDEVREYEEGDDPRLVDWNVTARVGRPYVKKFVDERELTIVFVLDLSASMTGGFGPWSARQIAARVCACLALSAVKSHDKVGLIACSDAVETFLPPRNGRAHALRIVRDCLALRARGPGSSLAPALELAARVVRRHAIVFVVSDFLNFESSEALTLCARRHDVVAVRLLAPELAPPPRGLMRVRDPESGREELVDWGSARVRDAFAQRVDQWRRHVDGVLRRARVDALDVSVPSVSGKDVVGPAILRFFRMREVRRAKR